MDSSKEEKESAEEIDKALQLYKARVKLTSTERRSILLHVKKTLELESMKQLKNRKTATDRMMQAIKLEVTNRIIEKKLEFERQLNSKVETMSVRAKSLRRLEAQINL